MYKFSILIGFFLLMAGIHAAGQEIPRVHSFSSQEYQAQRQNWSITQAADRWMYFANSAGVLEYDGNRWQLLPLPNRQVVRAVAYARDKVFCGGFAEFGFWEKAHLGKWSYHSLSQPLKSGKAETEEIWHILAGEKFVLFQSFSTIFLYDYEKVTTLTPPGNIMFVQQIEDRLLFQVLDKGLYELLPGNSFRFVEGSEILDSSTVSILLPLPNGQFLAGTNNHGIFHFHDGQFTPWNNPLNEQLKKTQLNKGLVLQDGGLALGTILDGLFVLNPDGTLHFHLNQENGLQNNTVLALFEDEDLNLWVGLDKGIDLVEIRSPLTYFTDRLGKTGTIYSAALFEGQLYLGTNHGVFYKDWPDEKKTFQLVEGTQGQVWELKVFDGQLLCGHNDGTFLIEGRKARKISPVSGGWRTIRHPEQPDLLVQGSYNGIVIFKKDETGQWTFSHRVDGFLKPVKELCFDPSGNLWAVHSHRGLHCIRLGKDALRVEEIRHFERDSGLPTEFNLHIFVVNDTFIIHSGTSFFTFREDIQALEKITEIAGISLPGTARIHTGATRDWFISRNKELDYIHEDTLHRLEVQLIPGDENIVNLENGLYLFCLNDGYALLRETDRSHLKFPQEIHPVLRTVEKYGKNGYRFSIACPQFTQEALFRYKLEGYDANWTSWKPASTKEYMNLSPGNYLFHVQSNFSAADAVFSFSIPPPWYLSKWAGLLYLLIGAGLIWGVYLLSQRRLSHHLQKLEMEKMREFEKERMSASNERLHMEIRSKNNELANSTINLIRKNETLSKIKAALQKLPEAEKPSRELKKLLRLIDEHITSDHDWELLEESFNNVHGNFFKKLKAQYADLTPGDLRLAAYLKMNLTSKEIAQLLNLTIRGVENKRYRLRKKLNLTEETNLTEFMIQF